MSGNFARHQRLERLLARVLDQGTWLALGIIGVGWLLSVAGWQSVALINGGIALFLLLPVLRVAIMLVGFVRERDYRFGLIAGVVLAIIVLGALLGIGIRNDCHGHPRAARSQAQGSDCANGATAPRR